MFLIFDKHTYFQYHVHIKPCVISVLIYPIFSVLFLSLCIFASIYWGSIQYFVCVCIRKLGPNHIQLLVLWLSVEKHSLLLCRCFSHSACIRMWCIEQNMCKRLAASHTCQYDTYHYYYPMPHYITLLHASILKSIITK